MLLSDLQLPAYVNAHLEWFVAGLLIVVGLAMAGFGDWARLSLTRIWAISGVCFQESIRRRVLWITPLTIIGVIVAVQLLNPLDEQDAVRQTIKYSLFATGALVMMVTIILACTNLPKEIDNRVIFTIVTKPVTRLEIVLGKIVGFGRVSATLLAIMGLFTLAYAELRGSQLQSNARSRLENLSPSDSSRPALEHYAKFGLLQSKTYFRPIEFQQFARIPSPDDALRWMNGNDEQTFVVTFDLPPEMFPEAGSGLDNGGLIVLGRIAYEFYEGHQDWHPTPFPGDLPSPAEFKGFSLKEQSRPAVTFDILGPDRFNFIPPTELPGGGTVQLNPLHEGQLQELLRIPGQSLDRPNELFRVKRRLYIKLAGQGSVRYAAGPETLKLFSPKLKEMGQSGIIEPLKGADGKPEWPVFRGRDIMGGQQLRGGADLAKVATGVFAFRNVALPASGNTVPAELRLGIEGSGEEASALESVTRAIIQILNKKTGKMSEVIDMPIESNRTVFFNLPVDAMGSGDFDVHLRCLGPGHYLIVRNAAANSVLQLVTAEEPFSINLFKSLLIMWLMSLLVIIIAIFCSTFVSWPIAVVLTIVILLGHWGAMQIGDANATGMGAQIQKDMFPTLDPGKTKVLTSAVDNLSRFLNVAAKVLPDIAQFSATEDIERGVTIAPQVIGASIKVIAAFGLPLTMLAYVFLKRKEVAP